MIEEIFDETYGLISAARVYECATSKRGVHYAQIDDGHTVEIVGPKYLMRDDFNCFFCGRGPILWDQWRYSSYVLVPWFIREEP